MSYTGAFLGSVEHAVTGQVTITRLGLLSPHYVRPRGSLLIKINLVKAQAYELGTGTEHTYVASGFLTTNAGLGGEKCQTPSQYEAQGTPLFPSPRSE